jgi:SRSO17 transposase
VDNCQVAVFGVLTDGHRHAPVDMRLYLPKPWLDNSTRCDEAGVPESARKPTSIGCWPRGLPFALFTPGPLVV